MPTIQQILDDAKANPNTPQATQLRQMIESGALDKRAAVEGVQLPGRPKPVQQPKTNPNGWFSNLLQKSNSYQKGVEIGQRGVADIKKGNVVSGAIQVGGGLVSSAESIIEPIIGAGKWAAEKTGVDEPIKKAAGWVAEKTGLDELPEKYDEQTTKFADAVYNLPFVKEALDSADPETLDRWARTSPEAGKILNTILTFGGSAAGKKAVDESVEATKFLTKETAGSIGKAADDVKTFVSEFKPITPAEQVVKDTGFIQIGNKKIPTTDSTISGGILQSMHKPIPTKAQAFAESSGVPMGEWLVERGIIDTPENTVKKLFDRFTKAKEQADLGFDAIPGRFQDPTLFKVADSLLKLEREIAQKGASSADKKFVEHLASNLQEGGLTMREVNSLKRLYERKVKTEYLKDSTKTSSDVQATTNLDTKLRQWQADKAKELGFDDLAAINKETMQSRAAMDAIGERFLRKQSNNAVSLTDWIVATGGASNPAFFGTLFGKKLISSDTFQALFAKALAKKATIGEPAINSLGSIGRKAKIQENAQAIRDAKSATQPVLPREGKIPQKPSAETLSQPTSEVKPPSFSKASPAESATPKEFQKLVSMAQTPDRSLTHLSIEELSKLKTSVLPNKKGGFALNSVDKNGKIELTNVFVSPEHRGTGIGKEVMQSAIDSAKQNGAKNIELDAYKYLEPFYNKFGFKTYRQEQFNPKFSKGFDPRIKGQESKHDVVFMRLNLK